MSLQDKLDQAYRDRESIDRNIRELKSEIEAEKAFKVGDRLVSSDDGITYRVLVTRTPDNKIGLVILTWDGQDVSPNIGKFWNSQAIKTDKVGRITLEELNQITFTKWRKEQ